MLKRDFNKVAKHGCSPVNFLHIFRTPFPKKHLWKAASGETLTNYFMPLVSFYTIWKHRKTKGFFWYFQEDMKLESILNSSDCLFKIFLSSMPITVQ